ncbi:DUF3418 domain-containing protein [Nonomuraea dietziae]|uniref:DUF3418 domain-containing protein n=1 Tax=Nonomuraea dietziae TaxID=65515 RepID=UPI003CD0B419
MHIRCSAQPGQRRRLRLADPGLREELVTALIRSLPKNIRRNFVPLRPTTPSRCSSTSGGRRAAASRRWSASCCG